MRSPRCSQQWPTNQFLFRKSTSESFSYDIRILLFKINGLTGSSHLGVESSDKNQLTNLLRESNKQNPFLPVN